MALGDGTGWDKTTPVGSTNARQLDDHILDLRKGVTARLEKEHRTLADSGVGGEHRPGSGMAYFQTATPIVRPDGTALTDDDNGRLWVNSDNGLSYVLKTGSTANWQRLRGASFAVLTHQSAPASGGGSLTAGQWNTRPITNVSFDPDGIVSVANNRFQLVAGKYIIRAVATAIRVDLHQIRLQNITSNTTAGLGTTAFSPSNTTYNAWNQIPSELSAYVAPTANTHYEIQHIVQTGYMNGMGYSVTNFGVNHVWMTVEIWKLQ